MYSKIMVAIDDSKEAEGAFAEALELAVLCGSSLTIATVVEPLPGFYEIAAIVAPDMPQQLVDLRRQKLLELQNKVASKAANLGISSTSILRQGQEVEELVKAAKEVTPDLLVLGLHKHDLIARWVGTAHLVAQAVNCSVLAVQRA